jgi:lipopolysaccharide biosynthesis glycosyltransferase
MHPEPIVVACSADRAYALPLAVMLRSAGVNLDPRRTLDVYVVDGGLGNEMRMRILASLPQQITLHWVAPERNAFIDLPLWGRMTINTYDKLTIAQSLPKSVRRTLWLDSDLLVLADLTALWDLKLCEYSVLAVPDVLVGKLGGRFGVAGYRELGMDGDAEYFNAGVMSLDLERWRKDEVASGALEYLKRHRRRVYFWEQEALNVVLFGKWGRLDSRWNCNPTLVNLVRRNAARDDEVPWIVHFSGSLKPWNFAARSYTQNLFYRYLDQTAWAGWRPPQSWRTAAMNMYQVSALRNMLYPLEPLLVDLIRSRSLHYVSWPKNEPESLLQDL